LSKNYCAELELSVFSIINGGRSNNQWQPLGWKPNNTNLLLRQQCCYLVWHTSSKLLILMSLFWADEATSEFSLLRIIKLLFT